jgi:hypothetical protein
MGGWGWGTLFWRSAFASFTFFFVSDMTCGPCRSAVPNMSASQMPWRGRFGPVSKKRRRRKNYYIVSRCSPRRGPDSRTFLLRDKMALYRVFSIRLEALTPAARVSSLISILAILLALNGRG